MTRSNASDTDPAVAPPADAAVGRRWNVIIVGAGLGGLTGAAYLATNGQRVLVLERYKVSGGSSHVFRRKGMRIPAVVRRIASGGHAA